LSKLTISPLAAGFRSSNKLNENFEAIQTALENTLSRDGTTPNQMSDVIDMNSNRIINLDEPIDDNDAVRLVDVADAIELSTDIGSIDAAVAAAEASADAAAATLASAAIKANNLSDLTSAPAALTNLGGTTVGKAVFTAANAAAARTAIGTTIGTDVQAYDADLSAIAGLTSAADKFPYATGAGTWALSTVTSFARSLMAAVDNSAFLTALGQIASSFVNFVASGTGAATRNVQTVLRETVRLNDFTGADPTNSADSRAALVAAIAATPEGGTLIVCGAYRIGASVTITKSMTIRGEDQRVGNYTGAVLSKSQLYFDQNTDGFIVDGKIVTFDGVLVIGVGGATSGYDGIRTVNVNNAVLLTGNTLVQGWNCGVRLADGYYNKLSNVSIIDCITCLAASNIYNLPLVNVTLQTTNGGSNKVALALSNGCSVVVTGGSIENFTAYGAILTDGSSISFFGTYWEGFGGPCIFATSGCSVTAISNHVYLNVGCTSFISQAGGGSGGLRIFSRNNRLVLPSGSAAVDVYSPNNSDALAYTDIAGDDWVSPGANCKYLSTTFTGSGSGVTMFTGSHRVEYPLGHPDEHKPLTNRPITGKPTISALSGTIPVGTMIMHGSNGFSGDDPLSLRTAFSGAWGANPYWAIYHKGQWEKLGLRIPDIAAPTGGATVDTEARAFCASLRTALINSGVVV